MKNDEGLTQEQFELLLAWLDPDPVRAGERYEKIRRRLIAIFLNRRCQEAEDLADKTINRVAKKVGELKDSYVGDPARYFYGVAKKLLLEYHRQHGRPIPSPPPPVTHEELEQPLACLDKCLAQLPPENKELILHYYQEQKKAKIAAHKELGEQLRLKAGALRARIFRIRAKLEECLKECLRDSPEGNDI
ncbi:MAG TPA: sigma-70 family RNA polymerase sigma factor [Pyrinomonadaceae bacterium]|jgi:RNA polymerase sigma factor (sigma-70 family)